ncbi:MAG: MarR family transcriptional regulator [Cytophagales bacterium]|nr:MarR family transcriptional regulator [Cytophagales bacterium]
MTIEQEIKQKKFKNEYHKLAVNLQFTTNWLRAQYSKTLKKFGISPQQYNVLRILKGQYPNPSSLLLIRDRMLDRESNASRLIDKLVSSGLTRRIQCPNDRRQVEITITEKGIGLLEEINPLVDEVSGRLECIDKNEAIALNNLLDKLRSN